MQEARVTSPLHVALGSGKESKDVYTVVYPLDDQRLYGADRLTIKRVNQEEKSASKARTRHVTALEEGEYGGKYRVEGAWVVRSKKCTEERDSDRSRMDPVRMIIVRAEELVSRRPVLFCGATHKMLQRFACEDDLIRWFHSI
jgi:hypothetical protein